MDNYTDNIIVVVTIGLFVFLGYKIYVNKKLMRPAGSNSSKGKADDIMHGLDKPELWVKLAKGEAAATPDEDMRMSLMVNAAFQGFETQCAEADTLGEHEHEVLKASISRIVAMPGVDKYLSELKSKLSTRLQSIIDEIK